MQVVTKVATGTAGSALLAHAALHGQLAWVELQREKNRLLQMSLVLLAGFSLLTSLLVAVTTALLLATWNTPYSASVMAATGFLYGAGMVLLWLRFSMLAAKGDQAFCGTREELAEDMTQLRSRFEQ
jgi:uncharacterized membrane protein YqjE